jgi:hypothetical protein
MRTYWLYIPYVFPIFIVISYYGHHPEDSDVSCSSNCDKGLDLYLSVPRPTNLGIVYRALGLNADWAI